MVTGKKKEAGDYPIPDARLIPAGFQGKRE